MTAGPAAADAPDHAPDHVDVTWTLDDARAFTKVVVAAQMPLIARPEGWLWRRAAALAGAVIVSVLAFVITASPAIAAGGAIIGFLLVVAGMWANHLSQTGGDVAEGLFRNDPLAYEARRFSVTETALVEQRPGLRGEIEWGRILRISRESGLIIIWITKIDAMPIPERCFAGKADADAFHAELQARVAAAAAA
jgi:hypothetical protein